MGGRRGRGGRGAARLRAALLRPSAWDLVEQAKRQRSDEQQRERSARHYGARVDDDRDLLGDDDRDDERPEGGVLGGAAGAPEALALASLVLAAVSVAGFGLLNGPPYLPALYSGGGPPVTRLAVTASLIGAGLALLPAALGAVALRRLPEVSAWRAVAGAGVLVAVLSAVLRLAIGALTAADDSVQFVQF